MDLEDYVWAAIVIYSIIKRVLQRGREKPAASEKSSPRRRPSRTQDPQPRVGRARPPVATTAADLAAQTGTALQALVSQVHTFRSGLDAAVQRALGSLLEQEIEAPAARLLVEVERTKADSIRLTGIARAAREHILASTRLLSSLDAIAKRRADATLSAIHRAADRLVAAAAAPIERHLADDATNLGAPLPLVMDGAQDSPIFRTIALLPTATLDRPYHWALLGPALGRWVVQRARGLDQEVGSKLELDTDASSDAGPDRIARVLFGAWRGTLLADALAAQWLGPSYLSALSWMLRDPATPSTVVSVAINRDGVVQSEPPPHVRIHLVARWLAIVGTPESDLAPILADWDGIHGDPQSLRLTGEYRGSQIPLVPFLATSRGLLERLHSTPLDSIGGGRLADLPGFDNLRQHATLVTKARSALSAQRPSRRHLRATLAAAIESALTAPGSASAINAWLLRSTADSAPASARAARPSASPSFDLRRDHITRRHAAHALVLGEILLNPCSRS